MHTNRDLVRSNNYNILFINIFNNNWGMMYEMKFGKSCMVLFLNYTQNQL